MNDSEAPAFHFVTVGWSARLIEGILDRVRARANVRFSHLVLTQQEFVEFRPREEESPVRTIRPDVRAKMPTGDPEYLRTLEADGIPTIHNMILADRVVRNLDYDDALGYATFLGQRLTVLYQELRPSVIIGGFDSLHGGIGLAVARKLGIPWYAMYFTTLPQGSSGFCAGMTPDTIVAMKRRPDAELQALARGTIEEFRNRRIVVAAYESSRNLLMILRRLPVHISAGRAALWRLISGRYDRYTEYPVWRLVAQYLRRRKNLALLPKDWFRDTLPSVPYVFFGLHMQPESSIDTWAPFYANQFNLVELLARSIPPTHQLLVKLHRSDADNYSRKELNRLRRIPGVHLVAPFAQSRTFIESASLVAAIQGTIAVEAALLCKPVLMFGDSPVHSIPGVTRVDALRDLPAQIRRLLAAEPPTPRDLEQGFAAYLGLYGPGCYYDWERTPSDEEIDNLSSQFVALRDHTVMGTAEGLPAHSLTR